MCVLDASRFRIKLDRTHYLLTDGDVFALVFNKILRWNRFIL